MPERMLYSYYKSSCSWRVRIALNLLGIDYEQIAIDLVAGEQHEPAFRAINPQGFVPVFEDGLIGITQSLAILRHLDGQYRPGILFPTDPIVRPLVDELTLIIAAGTQPFQNLATRKHLESIVDSEARRHLGAIRDLDSHQQNRNEIVREFCRAFVESGLAAFEAKVLGGSYCVGELITAADICLVPQLAGARRWGINVEERFPRLAAIEANCNELPAFQAARPENQPDCPDNQADD